MEKLNKIMKTLLLVLVMMINAKAQAQTQEEQRPANGGGGPVIPLCNTSGCCGYYLSRASSITASSICRTAATQTINLNVNFSWVLQSGQNCDAYINDITNIDNYPSSRRIDYSIVRPNSTPLNITGTFINPILVKRRNCPVNFDPNTNAVIGVVCPTSPSNYSQNFTFTLTSGMLPVNDEGEITFFLRDGSTTVMNVIIKVFPQPPTYSGISVNPSCPSPGTNANNGSITISGVTAYQNARLYLTPTTIAIGPTTPPTAPCPQLGVYPNCYSYPNGPVFNGTQTLLPNLSPQTFTIPDLAPGTYYLTLINFDVTTPFTTVSNPPVPLCAGVNIPIIVPVVSPLTGFNSLPAIAPPISAADYTTIDSRSVISDTRSSPNPAIFVSNIKAICCPNTLADGAIGLSISGGKPFPTAFGNQYQLKIQRSDISTTLDFQPTLATAPTTLVSSNDVINGLIPGIYKLTIRDDCGISMENTVIIKKPIEITPNASVIVNNPVCTTANLGNVTLSLQGIKTNDNYAETSIPIRWRAYSIVSNVETFVSASTTLITIIPGTPLSVNIPNLPAGNYRVYVDRTQFLWTPANSFQCNLTDSFVPGGIYPCDSTPYTFTINAVTPLSVPTTGAGAPTSTLVTCPTGTNTLTPTTPDANSNGIITMTASGTTAGGLYVYELLKEIAGTYTPVATQTSVSANFTGLSAGNYKITIKRNVVGCTDAVTSSVIVVSEPPPLVVSSIIQNISCYGATSNDGSITVTISGGTPFTTPAPATPYQLTLSSGGFTLSNPPVRNGNQYIYSNLPQGDYRLAITDANQCSRFLTNNSIDFSIVEPLQLAVTGLTINNIICSTDVATIVPTVAVGTGTAPYRFFYQVAAATPIEYVATDAFTAGTYTISVRDSRGCVAVFASGVSNTVTINSATTPIVAPITLSSFSGGYQISCLNGNNGQITISSATGGNGVGFTNVYQYKINKTAPTLVNGTYQNSTVAGSNVFAGLTRGTYDVFVKDSRGCEKVQTFTLTEPSIAIGYSVSIIQNVICANDATGRITITPTGGSGIGYQVAIRKQGSTTTLIYVPVTGVTYTFGALPGTGLRADTYDIYVKDSNGCTSQAQPQTVGSAYPLITVATVQNNTSCLGAAPDGALTITPTAGTAPFIYRWIGSSNTTNTRTGLVAGIYQLEITDANACTEPFTFTITQPALVLSATATTGVACYQQTNGKITIVPMGGTPPYQYSKDNGNTWQIPISNVYVFANLAPQVYNLKLKDSKNCIFTVSKTVTERGDTPKIAYLVSTRQNAEDEIVLVNVSVPEPTSTLWEFDANTTVISQANDKAVVRYNAPGNFPVKMIASFTDCVYTSTKNISISPLDTPIPGVTLGTRPIASAIVTPNPNNGNFDLALTLNKRQYVHLILVDAMGNIRYEDKNTTTRFLSVNKNIAVDIPSGVYNLRIITDDDAKDIRITVVR